MKYSIVSILLVILLGAADAWSCSSEEPIGYFYSYYQSGRSFLYIPETHFDSDYIRIMNASPNLGYENTEFPQFGNFFDGDTLYKMLCGTTKQTLNADVADLEKALASQEDRDAILAAYQQLRAELNQYVLERRRKIYSSRYNNYNDKEPEPIAPFDIDRYYPVLLQVPEEFSLYMLGAVDYHHGNYVHAKTCFALVLTLPSEKRPYKTLWATYMLGRTCLALKEYEEAQSYFEETRRLVSRGYPDPLNLAAESWGWQGRAHLLAGEHFQATKAYIEYRKVPGKWNLTKVSLFEVFRAAAQDDDTCAEFTRDAQLRQLFTAWQTRLGGPMDATAQRWLNATAALPTEGLIEGADSLAWLAYQSGDMTAAARWLRQSAPESAYARWVQAKLLLYEGKIQEGNALLKTLINDASESDRTLCEGSFCFSEERVLLSHYAGSLLKSEDYYEALKTMLSVDSYDSQFIALYVMTIPELQAAIQRLKEDDRYVNPRKEEHNPPWRRYELGNFRRHLEWLQPVLAQRLARSGKWQEASTCLRQDASHGSSNPLCEEVGNHLSQADNAAVPLRERAEHYFKAGKIIRESGEQLLGMWGLDEERPDFGKPLGRESLFTEAGEERIAQHKKLCGQKYHYRFISADLMKKCAELLPNNDVLAAEALYLGGMALKDKHPKEADYFYKALVRRNPNLLIAQQADALRWFPRNFDATVLYTARPKEFWPRKRTIALWIGAGMALPAGGLAAALFMKRRKRKAMQRDD